MTSTLMESLAVMIEVTKWKKIILSMMTLSELLSYKLLQREREIILWLKADATKLGNLDLMSRSHMEERNPMIIKIA